nr:MAG TPA: hypothetical protein [Caudoviricetes sp.]
MPDVQRDYVWVIFLRFRAILDSVRPILPVITLRVNDIKLQFRRKCILMLKVELQRTVRTSLIENDMLTNNAAVLLLHRLGTEEDSAIARNGYRLNINADGVLICRVCIRSEKFLTIKRCVNLTACDRNNVALIIRKIKSRHIRRSLVGKSDCAFCANSYFFVHSKKDRLCGHANTLCQSNGTCIHRCIRKCYRTRFLRLVGVQRCVRLATEDIFHLGRELELRVLKVDIANLTVLTSNDGLACTFYEETLIFLDRIQYKNSFV